METASSLMMFAFQSSYDVNGHDIHLIMESELVIAAVMLLLILGVLIAGVVALVYVKKLMATVDELKGKALPMISKGSDLVDDLAPKIRSITTNIEEISFTARAKVDELGQTVTQINRTVADINAKTQVQANRVDGIVTTALATTREVSDKLQYGIRVPIRQAAGVIAGIKAALQTLAERSPVKPKAPPGSINPYDL